MMQPGGWDRVGRRVTRVAAGLLMAAGAVVDAQDPARTITVGATVEGRLGRTDPVVMGRGAFHAYRFEAVEGGRYRITMRSADVDAYVWVAQTIGGLTDQVVSDDDGGGDTDAQLLFRPARAGTYLIVAPSLDAEETGSYTLAVAGGAAPRAGRRSAARARSAA